MKSRETMMRRIHVLELKNVHLAQVVDDNVPNSECEE
jgi:hypothetical protein